MEHKNLYSERFPFGNPQLRTKDELWEDNFKLSADDSRFQVLWFLWECVFVYLVTNHI